MSMTNGRFITSTCRGMLQKMGVLYIHSSKMPGSSTKVSKKEELNIKNWKT
jgi:hypothetical protein